MAVRAGWGAGKIEARPEADLRRPLSAALHRAIRDLAVRHPEPDRVDEVLGILKAFALRSAARRREAARPLAARHRRRRPLRPRRLRRHRDRPRRAVHRGRDAGLGRAERRRHPHRRDAGPPPRRRLGAVRGVPRAVAVAGAARGRRRGPAAPARRALGVEVVLGAPLHLRPHRPARPRGRRLRPPRPGRTRRCHLRRRRPRRPLRRVRRIPLLRPGLRQGQLGRRGALPITAADVKMAAPEAEASWPSASSAPASSGPPRPSASTSARWPSSPTAATSRSARRHRRRTCSGRASSLSPARDSLMKKGLVFSAQRGQIAFTVPHFGRYLLAQV